MFGFRKIYVFTFISAFSLSSCNIINRDEQEPAYLAVNQFALTTNEFIQGSASSEIKDCWIFADDQAIGTYEMPFKIPTIKTGTRNLKVFPGVFLNGSGFVRIAYPFYRPYEINLNLAPGSTSTINPTTTYYEDVIMPVRINFDDASGIPLEASSQSDTVLQIITNNAQVFEGNGSGLIELKRSGQGFCEVQTINNVVLPKQGRSVYLEFNYQSNYELAIGVIGLNPNLAPTKTVTAFLEPNTEWKKIYMNITAQVSAAVQATGYKVFFGAAKPNGGEPMKIYLDNIKLVYAP
jgi:hypothetical protein